MLQLDFCFPCALPISSEVIRLSGLPAGMSQFEHEMHWESRSASLFALANRQKSCVYFPALLSSIGLNYGNKRH